MTQDEIIDMAIQAHVESKTWIDIYKDSTTTGDARQYLEAFAKLVAAKEREAQEKEMAFLKEAVERQLLIIKALNDIVGGENHGGTTSNILAYSRWERRVADAIQKEREACAKVCDDIGMFHEVSQGADLCFALSKAIRARGEA